MLDIKSHRQQINEGGGFSIKDMVVLLTISLFVGMATGLVSVVFIDSIIALEKFVAQLHGSQTGPTGLLIKLAIPTAAGLVVGIIMHQWSNGRMHGPADVIMTAQVGSPLPRTKTVLANAIASVISLGSGASLGQYGPMVLLGGSIGRHAARLKLNIPDLQAVIMGCGVAAAISGAFHAPIAGVLFAHEVVLRHYSLRTFGPMTISSTVAYVLTELVTDRATFLPLQAWTLGDPHEYILFAFMGVFAALIATVFMRFLLWSSHWASRSAIHPMIRPALAGIVVGLFMIFLPQATGTGVGTMRQEIFLDELQTSTLLMLLLGKMLLTAVCLSFGFAGGLFGPALVVGSAFGGLFFNIAFDLGLASITDFSFFAITGMIAVSAPIIGAPVSAIVMVLELTGNYAMAISAMAAVALSTAVTSRIFGRSFYDRQIFDRGIDLSRGREHARLASRSIRGCLVEGIPVMDPSTSQADVVARLSGSPWHDFFLVKDGKLCGMISRHRLDHQSDQPVDSLIVEYSTYFVASQSIAEAMVMLEYFAGSAIPVLDNDEETLVGFVTEGSVVAGYLDVAGQVQREEHALL
ncbi:MAG: chloride channel protein [SAR116 cluster bacterium]|nr:MAG: chloride channel protein [SAR116 cluster bacterium]HBQ23614.1 hypothetical protein [Alphaproteobacteria bacterium]|tara:strand:- start:1769 stop:3505 length:1737 start_codon:yes stop_codon:yes gene_type:complete